MGAKPQPNSGATPWAKEDMKDAECLYQHKEMTRSHTVRKDHLEDLRRNAIDEGLHPVYVIEYGVPHRRWFMIDERDWNAVNEYLRQLQY